jgi:CubicO group peptidase (beta-lactamase class C family)
MDLVQPESLGMNSAQLSRIGEHMCRNYVEPGKIPGSLTMVSRRGEACYLDVAGLSDVERKTPLTSDTIMRIYSMTKPITSVALMTLFERGLFSLSDPVHRFIPSWKNLRVRKGGAWPLFETEPCKRPMTIRDLFMHTSGLTYGFLRASNIDRAYRKQGVGDPRPGYSLKDMMDQLAELPLEFSPGERWNYSVSTDVLAYLVEVISGKSFEAYLQEVILDPLGMVDTGFNIPSGKLSRFGSCYQRNMAKELVLQDDGQASEYRDRTLYSGGGGLLSTLGDYNRFCQMLLNGGTLHGQRIIGPRTLALMTNNHLPGGADMSQFATGSFSETAYEGVGFGLGFANKLDSVRNGFPASNGSFFWGGLASTLFWVDPAEELVVIFMTQLIPSSTFNFRGQLEALVYAALD